MWFANELAPHGVQLHVAEFDEMNWQETRKYLPRWQHPRHLPWYSAQHDQVLAQFQEGELHYNQPCVTFVATTGPANGQIQVVGKLTMQYTT